MPTRLLAPLLLLIAAAAAVLADGRLLVSGGGSLLPGDAGGTVLRLPSEAVAAAAEGCKMTYGFLPCTDTALGNLFLVLAYGFLMFKSATYLSAGSELLLEILGPGIVGGLFLPILGALPDAMLILVSGLSGSKEVAQSQVLIGMGLLAGSTVMLLTLLWGSCVVVGKCDLSENSTAIDSQDTKCFSLFGSGVSTDVQTSYAAKIMAISVFPFIIVQIPQIFKLQSGHRLTVLLGLIVAALLVLAYCLYQIFQPWIQRRRLEYARLKHVMSGLLRHAQKNAIGHLLDEDGRPNAPVIEKLFDRIDRDNDGKLERGELQAFIIGVNFEDIDLDSSLAADQVMADFDTSQNHAIEKAEFVDGILRWLGEAKRSVPSSGAYSNKFLQDFHARTRDEHNMLLGKDDEGGDAIEYPTWTCFKAISLLLLGTAMAAAFADPLVDAVHNFSNAPRSPPPLGHCLPCPTLAPPPVGRPSLRHRGGRRGGPAARRRRRRERGEWAEAGREDPPASTTPAGSRASTHTHHACATYRTRDLQHEIWRLPDGGRPASRDLQRRDPRAQPTYGRRCDVWGEDPSMRGGLRAGVRPPALLPELMEPTPSVVVRLRRR